MNTIYIKHNFYTQHFGTLPKKVTAWIWMIEWNKPPFAIRGIFSTYTWYMIYCILFLLLYETVKINMNCNETLFFMHCITHLPTHRNWQWWWREFLHPFYSSSCSFRRLDIDPTIVGLPYDGHIIICKRIMLVTLYSISVLWVF